MAPTNEKAVKQRLLVVIEQLSKTLKPFTKKYRELSLYDGNAVVSKIVEDFSAEFRKKLEGDDKTLYEALKYDLLKEILSYANIELNLKFEKGYISSMFDVRLERVKHNASQEYGKVITPEKFLKAVDKVCSIIEVFIKKNIPTLHKKFLDVEAKLSVEKTKIDPLNGFFSSKNLEKKRESLEATFRTLWTIVNEDKTLKTFFQKNYDSLTSNAPQLDQNFLDKSGVALLKKLLSRITLNMIKFVGIDPKNEFVENCVDKLLTIQYSYDFSSYIKELQGLQAVLESGFSSSMTKLSNMFDKYKDVDIETLDKEMIAKKAEASAKAPLEMIAFAEERLDNVPSEKDTKLEKTLHRALKKHVNQNTPLDQESASLITKMMKNSLYPKMFKEPSTDVVYRGMSVTEEFMLKAGFTKEELRKKSSGKREVSMTFTPKRGSASSWTTVKSVTEQFKSGYSNFQIVLHANVEDNQYKFVDLKGGLYKVAPLDSFEDEKETIGLGKIKVSKIEWKKSK